MGLGDTGRVFGPGTIVPETWFHQVVQVRPGASRLDLLAGLATVTSGAPAPAFSVAQLPYRPHDAWLGGKRPPQVSAFSVSVSMGVAGATYTLQFLTSPQGQIQAGGTITLVAPPGTTWPSALNAYQVLSQSNGDASLQAASVSTAMGSVTDNQVVLTLQGATVGAGDAVAIQVTGIQNPAPADGYTLTVYTSADDVGVTSSPFSIAGTGGQPSPAPPTRDRVALEFLAWPGFQGSAALAAGGANPQPVAGLVFDDWSERIPSQLGTAGLVFHHDEPWSQAPQAILLAVNPLETDVWGDGDPIDALRNIIEATIDLTRIRTVDVPGLAMWGQVIPPLFVPYNPNNDTVCTLLYSPIAVLAASKPPSVAMM
jgi:hypothetical protein